MQSILRPVCVWFAMLCLACSSLLPLAAASASALPERAMTICSVTPATGVPLLPAANSHCHPCCNLPVGLELPQYQTRNMAAVLHYTLLPAAPQFNPLAATPAHSQARAPPV